MNLKKENKGNKILTDLDNRNANWDLIEGKLVDLNQLQQDVGIKLGDLDQLQQDIENKPDREELFSGDWNDLINKPSLEEEDTPLRKVKGGNLSVFQQPTKTELLEEVQRLNLNTVFVPVLIDAVDTEDSEPTFNEDNWDYVKDLVIFLNNQGIQTAIEAFPMVDEGRIVETEWEPSDMELWFTSWGNALNEIASFAEDNNVLGVNISSNLVHMESYYEKWSNLISEVRTRYNGLIFYRVNWWWDSNGFDSVLNNANLAEIDVISIAAYFEITAKDNEIPTYADIYEGLRNTQTHGRGQDVAMEIEQLHQRWGKPIFFGELGCPPYKIAPSQPYAYQYDEEDYVEVIQDNWYRAWYDTFRSYDWWLGYSVFSIGDQSIVYKVLNNLAEKTIRYHDFSEFANYKQVQEMLRRIEALEQGVEPPEEPIDPVDPEPEDPSKITYNFTFNDSPDEYEEGNPPINRWEIAGVNPENNKLIGKIKWVNTHDQGYSVYSSCSYVCDTWTWIDMGDGIYVGPGETIEYFIELNPSGGNHNFDISSFDSNGGKADVSDWEVTISFSDDINNENPDFTIPECSDIT